MRAPRFIAPKPKTRGYMIHASLNSGFRWYCTRCREYGPFYVSSVAAEKASFLHVCVYDYGAQP